MENWQPAMDDLAASWCRFDWRESFLAPGFHILQALTPDGQTASGAGLSRDDAYLRCIGETAEIQALDRLRDQGGTFDPSRDGIAAHSQTDAARDAALCEACERRAVAAWWLGQIAANPVAPVWLERFGQSGLLAQMRQGAALRRRTDWWLIPQPGGPCVMVCRSTSPEGQDPVLGFGAHRDPVLAAEKALRELLLMEMNLMELLAARLHGQEGSLQPVARQIRDYARRSAYLFAQGPAVIPLDQASPESGWFDAPPTLSRIGGGASVAIWICRPDLPSPPFTATTGRPYL